AREHRALAAKAEQDRIEADAIAAAELQKQKEAQIAERRQEKLDRAIEAAFGGDLVKAEKAIFDAEKVGVDHDRIHWLRGHVYGAQGKAEDANREFEASIALKPSVAAYAAQRITLFSSGLETGNPFRRFDRTRVDLIRSMPPETAEDYLFRGHHTALTGKFDLAFAELDKAIEMRDTPFAHTWRGGLLGQLALDTGNAALIVRALDDIRQAKLRLSDYPIVRLHSLHVQLRAANLYREHGQPEKRKAALEEAGRDAEALKNSPGHGFVMSRVQYFEQVGKAEDALKLLDEASQLPKTGGIATPYALRLYEMGKDAEALRVLDKRLGPDDFARQMLQMLLWAEQPEIGPEKAYERYRELVASRGGEADSFDVSQHSVPALVLLGKRKEAAGLLTRTPAFDRPYIKHLTASKPAPELFNDAADSR